MWIYSIYSKSWLIIFPENLRLSSYSMPVSQFILSNLFEADILYCLTQPQLLATRGGFVTQFWPSISWETHCFPDSNTTPSSSSCWNARVLRETPRRTWRLQGWQWWAIEPTSAICLPLNHSLNETNKRPLGRLLSLGFVIWNGKQS